MVFIWRSELAHEVNVKVTVPRGHSQLKIINIQAILQVKEKEMEIAGIRIIYRSSYSAGRLRLIPGKNVPSTVFHLSVTKQPLIAFYSHCTF